MKALVTLLLLAGLLACDLATAQQFSQASVGLGSVASTEGGTSVRVRLNQTSILQGIMLQAAGGAVKVLEVRLNKLNGESVVVADLSKGDTVEAGQTAESANLADQGFILSVDVQMQSINDMATLDFSLVTNGTGVALTSEVRESTTKATNGCLQDLCIGTDVYVVQNRAAYQARVSGVQRDGRFELTFFGSYSGTSGNWSRSEIAVTTGCQNQVCVGDDVYRALPGDTRDARVVAIQPNGAFVLHFFDGSGLLSDIARANIAIKSGCGRSYCVGQEFIYTGQGEQRHLRLVAVQGDGKYVMYFFDAQGVGGNWSEAEVRALRPVRSRGGALPAPPSRGFNNGGLY